MEGHCITRGLLCQSPFFVYTGLEVIATQTANLFIQSGVPEISQEPEDTSELEQQVASLITWRNALTFRFVDNYSGDFKDLKPGINYVRTNEIGYALVELGGGRHKKDDVVDLSVGFVVKKKNGEEVKQIFE